MKTTKAVDQDRVQFRVREFGAVPIPELLPAAVRAAARAKQTYWVDLSDAGAFDHPNRSYTDSIPLRILKAIHNRQIVTEVEEG
jgi:hypothetical protein